MGSKKLATAAFFILALLGTACGAWAEDAGTYPAITGYSTEASAIEAINLGVAGYLTKPFRLPRILAATARALGEPLPTAEA